MGTVASNIEDAGNVMRERVAQDGDDWRVKILRRATMAAPPESIAIFDGAMMEQLLNPEPWLSKFAGGSPFYTFQVIHAKDRNGNQTTAFYTIPAIPGTPSAPNTKIVGAPGWNGPSTLIYPDPHEGSKPPQRNGAASWPGSAAQTNSEVPRPPSHGGDGGAGPLHAALAQLQAEREKLAEERHRFEMDATRREADAEKKKLAEALVEMRSEIRSLKEAPPPPPKDPTETIVKVVSILTPLVGAILPVIVGGREAAAKREDERLARERQDRAETLKLFETMHEKAQGQSADIMKVVTPMVDAVSMMGRTVLQNVAMMREMNQEPPQDDGVVGLIKTAIGAWAEAQARQPITTPPPMPDPKLPGQPAPAAAPAPAAPADHEVVEVSPEKMIEMLADEIKEKVEIEDLATAIVEALGEPDFVAAISKEGGALHAIGNRLGAEWSQDKANVEYVKALFQKVGEIAQARGVDVRPLFPA